MNSGDLAGSQQKLSTNEISRPYSGSATSGITPSITLSTLASASEIFHATMVPSELLVV